MENITKNATIFDPPGVHVNHTFLAIVSFAFVLTCALGSLGNVLLCYVIYARRSTRRTIHLLTLNLAVSDLMVLLLYLPMQLYQINSHMTWQLGEVPCKISYAINAVSINANLLTLIAITRDRYVAVTDPLTAHSQGMSMVRKVIVVIWIISCMIMLPLLFVVHSMHHFGDHYCYEVWPNILAERSYWIILFTLQLLLPIIYFTLAYTRIICILWQDKSLEDFSEDLDSAQARPIRVRREEKRKQQQYKLLRLAVILVVAYLLCVSPQHAFWFHVTYGTLGVEDTYAVYIFIVSNFLMIFNSLVNPSVYASQSRDMKKMIRRVLCRCLNVMGDMKTNGTIKLKRTWSTISTTSANDSI